MKTLDLLKGKIWFLLLGVILLAVSSIFSIMVLHRLHSSMKLRQQTFQLQTKIDNLDLNVKEWVLLELTHEKNPQNKELYVKSEILKAQTSELFLDIKSSLENDKESYERVQNLELEWEKIIESMPSYNVLDYFTFETKQLEKAQMDKIGVQNPLIDTNFRLIYFLSSTLLVLSAFVISAALYLYRREQNIKNKLIDQLRISNDQAQASSRLKSQILATVSHEIRTPLNGILGMCEILSRMEDLKPNVKNKLQVINSSGQTLNHIVQDILNFSKVEAGKIEANEKDFDLYKTCNDVIETLRFQASEKDVSLQFEYPENLGTNFKGDKDLISQILYNLVGNSIKFTNEGYVSLNIKDEGNKIGLHIIDTGIGIEKESLSKVFDPFFQEKSSMVSEKGTGLGLAICKRLVSLMNGRISLTSKKGEGSHFIVSLPLKKATIDKGSEVIESPASQEGNVYFSGVRALVVEDNPTNQIIITNMLDILKVEHIVASNGFEALKALEENTFDCVFMDCQMPEMDGYEATVELRKRGDKTTVFAMTANAAEKNIDKCQEVGMDDFISKPINLQALSEILEKYFERRLEKKEDNTLVNTTKESLQKQQEVPNKVPVASKDATQNIQDNIKQTLDRMAAETNKIVVSQILNSFCQSLGNIEKELHDNKEDLSQLNKIGHKYKSSSKLVGADAFSEVCYKIEKAQDLKAAHKFIEELKSMIPTVQKEIEELNYLEA